jgi:hypothetical protein
MTEQRSLRDYVAHFHIKHGVTQGFGIVDPDEIAERKSFQAEDSIGAIIRAEEYAKQLALNYIADPTTGKTTVTLMELHELEGRVIDVLTEHQKQLPAECWELVKPLLFPDGTHYAVECSWIEQFLAIGKAERKQGSQTQNPTGHP